MCVDTFNRKISNNISTGRELWIRHEHPWGYGPTKNIALVSFFFPLYLLFKLTYDSLIGTVTTHYGAMFHVKSTKFQLFTDFRDHCSKCDRATTSGERMIWARDTMYFNFKIIPRWRRRIVMKGYFPGYFTYL